MILDDILHYRRTQLAREMAKAPLAALRESDYQPMSLYDALRSKFGVIAEIKKASPSKGLIAAEFDPVSQAKLYEASGAAAISVLTEEHFFRGSGDVLRTVRNSTTLPLLRKDFIFDEYQIHEARALGADAILLIVAMLPDDRLHRLYTAARTIGLDCLVETHNEEELARAAKLGARIIGINNRDLRTFDVDLTTTERLASLVPKGSLLVSESGIHTRDDVAAVRHFGADAVLIGESLMRGVSLRELLTEVES